MHRTGQGVAAGSAMGVSLLVLAQSPMIDGRGGRNLSTSAVWSPVQNSSAVQAHFVCILLAQPTLTQWPAFGSKLLRKNCNPVRSAAAPCLCCSSLIPLAPRRGAHSPSATRRYAGLLRQLSSAPSYVPFFSPYPLPLSTGRTTPTRLRRLSPG
jgi:hypothetical protein